MFLVRLHHLPRPNAPILDLSSLNFFVQTLVPRFLVGLSFDQSISGLWRRVKSSTTSTSVCVHPMSSEIMTFDATALLLHSDRARRFSLFCLGLCIMVLYHRGCVLLLPTGSSILLFATNDWHTVACWHGEWWWDIAVCLTVVYATKNEHNGFLYIMMCTAFHQTICSEGDHLPSL